MALGLDLPTLGLALMIIGGLMVVLALAKRTGKYSRGDVGIVGAVLFAAGIVMGGIAALASVSAPAAPGEPATQELWEIRISRAVYWDTVSTDGVAVTGGTGVIAVDGKSADWYFARADFDDAGAAIDVDLDAINLNIAEFSGQTFQLIFDIGTYSSVVDVGAGTTRPMLDPDNVDASIPEVTYAGATSGSQVGDKYYVSIAAGGSDTAIEAEMSVNEASVAAMTVGTNYFVNVLADSENFSLLFHPTA